MHKVVLCGAALVFSTLSAGTVCAQPQPVGTEMANLEEDVRGLKQRVADLQLRVDQLEQDNSNLRNRAANNYATVAQLNEAVAEMNRSIKSATATTKSETLQQVSVQMEKLATQTNAAIESLANGINSRNAAAAASTPPSTTKHTPQTTFSDDYPKEGTTYAVQKGDTMATIVKKTGAKQQDIINANKISDPSKIQVGQSLFIPGGK